MNRTPLVYKLVALVFPQRRLDASAMSEMLATALHEDLLRGAYLIRPHSFDV